MTEKILNDICIDHQDSQDREGAMVVTGAPSLEAGIRLLHDQIEKAQSIAISGHMSPDGDSIGACLGLCSYIEDRYPGREVALFLEAIPAKFNFLKHSDRIRQQKEKNKVYDLYFALDCSEPERLKDFQAWFEKASFRICVDHHLTNQGFGDLAFVVPDASSTCEVLWDLLDEDYISRECAQALYTGLVHDTGVFRHNNTTGKVMRIAGALIDKGADSTRIINGTYYEKTYRQNLVLGRALLESILILDGRMIFSVFRKKDFDFYKVNKADLEGIVAQLMLTEGVEVALFMYQIEDMSYKVSLRSIDRVDVSKIASVFGGGGHKRAAGCNAPGNPRDIVMSIASYVEEQLNNPEENESLC